MTSPLRPGFKSTEFWLAVLSMLLGSALVILDHEQAGFLLLGGGTAKGAVYSTQRADFKRAQLNGQLNGQRPPS